MHLTHLSLTNFRTFTRLDMDVPRRTLLLVGDNAQGKTTLLEAIYLLATFTSFHAQNDRQMINFLEAREPLAVARLVAEYIRAEQPHRIEMRLIQEANGGSVPRFRKEILMDGVKRTVYEAMGQFTAVVFLPQSMRVIEGSPDDRRRYLNLTLAQAVPGYSRALSEYAQALTQRNALLKQLGERGGDADQLSYWDTIIAERGAFLIHVRIAALQELEQLATRIHHRLTNGQEVLQIIYQPGYDPVPAPEGQFSLPLRNKIDRSGLNEERIRKGMLQGLVERRREEIARGVTTLGPHRDEIRFLSNGIDLGDYGSRGQVRTAMLALKLAEVSWMKNRTGEWPILLLDEILAELDMKRRADLQSFLSEYEQTMLTTTDLHLFDPQFVSDGTVWRVEQGLVCMPQL